MALGNAVGNPLAVAYGGTGLTSAGTSGNVLTSNGSAWTSASPAAAGASLVFLDKQTPSSQASVIFTLSSSYNNYLVTWTNAVPGTSTDTLRMQISVDGSNWIASSYQSGILSFPLNTTARTNTNSTTYLVLSDATANTAGQGNTGYCYVFNAYLSQILMINGQNCNVTGASGAGTISQIGGINTGTTPIVALKLYMSTSNITGTFCIYGVRTA